MDIMNADFGSILTAKGKDFFVKRDESPGIFFQKYGLIWKRFMSIEEISSQWYQKYHEYFDLDEQNRLIQMPTLTQMIQVLKWVQESNNEDHDNYESVWTQERQEKWKEAGRTIPALVPRIDADFDKVESFISGIDSSKLKEMTFLEFFRNLHAQDYRVSTYLLFATRWRELNPTQSIVLERQDALESIERRREYNRLQMQNSRAALKEASGFGDINKLVTQQINETLKHYTNVKRIKVELALSQRYHDDALSQMESSLKQLKEELESPRNHSEIQHNKILTVLKSIASEEW